LSFYSLLFNYCFSFETYFHYAAWRSSPSLEDRIRIRIQFTILRNVFLILYLIGVIWRLKEFRRINFCSQYNYWLVQYTTRYTKTKLDHHHECILLSIFARIIFENVSNRCVKFSQFRDARSERIPTHTLDPGHCQLRYTLAFSRTF